LKSYGRTIYNSPLVATHKPGIKNKRQFSQLAAAFKLLLLRWGAIEHACMLDRASMLVAAGCTGQSEHMRVYTHLFLTTRCMVSFGV
jgi:hypothetical protein